MVGRTFWAPYQYMEPEKFSFDLAITATGDTFTPNPDATDWRLKELKPRGAPGAKYFPDGRVMTLPIHATLEELREVVGQPGRYRLDQVDGDGKLIEGAQSAYIVLGQLGKSERAAEAVSARPSTCTEDVLREVVRVNAELARQLARPAPSAADELLRDVVKMNTGLANAVIERFASMMDSGAGLIAAADGAGLPAREPAPATATNPDDEDADDAHPPTSPAAAFGIDVNHIIADVAKDIVGKVMSKGLPSVADMTDWGDTRAKAKAGPVATPRENTPTAAPTAQQPSAPTETRAPASTTADAMPRLDADQMRKVMAIYMALSADEAKLARELAEELSPAERQTWLAELSTLAVPEAVAKIRTLLGSDAKKGAAS